MTLPGLKVSLANAFGQSAILRELLDCRDHVQYSVIECDLTAQQMAPRRANGRGVSSGRAGALSLPAWSNA